MNAYAQSGLNEPKYIIITILKRGYHWSSNRFKVMAGHSKWANIQHRKNAQDAKRGGLFTRLIREVTIAARSGPDPAANSRLRLAIDKALKANLTKDAIERAVKRGSGTGDSGSNIEEIRYEGYGPGGVAFMVDCMTDNRNRTASEVRHTFSKYGGNLGSGGSVSYLFERMGVIVYATSADDEKTMEFAIDADAEDVVVNEDGAIEIITTPESFADVFSNLQRDLTADPIFAEVVERPKIYVKPSDEGLDTLEKMLDKLEGLDDVQSVHHNADLPELQENSG